VLTLPTTRFNIKKLYLVLTLLYVQHFLQFLYSCAGLLLLWAENLYTTLWLRSTSKVFCNMHNKNNYNENWKIPSALQCAGAFRLLRSSAPTQLRWNIMCFVWISEQTAIISLYSINWLVFIAETECVYCAVRTNPYTKQITFCLQMVH
jgi:hypothetical protein